MTVIATVVVGAGMLEIYKKIIGFQIFFDLPENNGKSRRDRLSGPSFRQITVSPNTITAGNERRITGRTAYQDRLRPDG
ncbi:MAG: hypothetical protein GDA35_06060 [Hyphomonadaceae bacterium]|nr:hypothetical protein [Hyphomonadaceae bacterium]